jgi:hypothetical protein
MSLTPDPVPPPIPFAVMPARHRRFPPWLVGPLSFVVVLGVIGTAADPGALRDGLLAPLASMPLLALVVLLLVVASTGPKPMGATPFDPDMPSYKALGPALLVTAGAVATVFVLRLGSLRVDPAVVFALAAAAVAGLIALMARPATFGAVEVPRSPRRRRSWIARWALAGVVLALGFDRTPPRGASPAWWLALPLGLTLTLGAVLIVAAALRPWTAGRAGRRTAALALALLVAAVLLVVTAQGRAWDRPAGPWWWYLAGALAVIAGIAVPSIRRSVRSVY